MPRRVRKPLRLREMTADERAELTKLSRSRKTEARVVERAAILLGLADGEKPARLARRLGVTGTRSCGAAVAATGRDGPSGSRCRRLFANLADAPLNDDRRAHHGV